MFAVFPANERSIDSAGAYSIELHARSARPGTAVQLYCSTKFNLVRGERVLVVRYGMQCIIQLKKNITLLI